MEEYLIARYDSLSPWELKHKTLIANSPQNGWQKFLNNQTTPELKTIIWPGSNGRWQGYTLPGTFFQPDTTMLLIDSSGDFCVAPNLETMKTYLETK